MNRPLDHVLLFWTCVVFSMLPPAAVAMPSWVVLGHGLIIGTCVYICVAILVSRKGRS